MGFNMKQLLQKIGILITLSMLVGCGLHLRGVNETSFSSIFIQGKPVTISKNLEKSFKNNNIKVVDAPEKAEVLLELLGEENEKRILSLSGGGVVREFELYYRVQYRTKKPDQTLWSEPQTVEARRDFSYSDANLLAKQGEEKRLNENMQSDVMNNLIRRLSALKK
jgi:LPS-assembly lipoprotein